MKEISTHPILLKEFSSYMWLRGGKEILRKLMFADGFQEVAKIDLKVLDEKSYLML